jgi:hypothetical protein
MIVSIALNALLLVQRQKPPALEKSLNLPMGYKAFEWPRTFGDHPLVGAIVEIAPHTGFRYITHLSKCGLDMSVLQPTDGLLYLPNISQQTSIEFGLNASKAKVAATTGLSSDSKLRYSTGPVTEKFLITGDVLMNAVDKIDLIKSHCERFLSSPNVYWISHALETKDVRFSFETKTGMKINLDASQAMNVLAKFGLEGRTQ